MGTLFRFSVTCCNGETMVGSGSWPWIKSAIFIFLRLSTPGERDEETNKQKKMTTTEYLLNLMIFTKMSATKRSFKVSQIHWSLLTSPSTPCCPSPMSPMSQRRRLRATTTRCFQDKWSNIRPKSQGATAIPSIKKKFHMSSNASYDTKAPKRRHRICMICNSEAAEADDDEESSVSSEEVDVLADQSGGKYINWPVATTSPFSQCLTQGENVP